MNQNKKAHTSYDFPKHSFVLLYLWVRVRSMVGEYHNLYEMQRRRLESQVDRLTDEKDLWSKVTYNLALKVIT